MIEPFILKRNRAVDLVTGLHFCQTEPRVLQRWLTLSRRANVSARICSSELATFHPKVLVVESPSASFAIVGSGNLSAGGFRDNFECALFTTRAGELKEINGWIDHLVDDRSNISRDLSKDLIARYAIKFDRAQKWRERLKTEQVEAEHDLTAQLSELAKAVRWAASMSRTSWFARDYDAHRLAQRRIKDLLQIPRFTFNRAAWSEFYKIMELGHLLPFNKEAVIARRQKLQNGLRHLCDEAVPIETRIDALLLPTGRYWVPYLGINATTKILACASPNRWPVLNGPVKTTLDAFGYVAGGSATIGEKYRKFSALIAQLRKASNLKDMLAMDVFLSQYYFRKLKK